MYYLIRANRVIYDVLLKIIHQSCVNSLGHFVNSSKKVIVKNMTVYLYILKTMIIKFVYNVQIAIIIDTVIN